MKSIKDAKALFERAQASEQTKLDEALQLGVCKEKIRRVISLDVTGREFDHLKTKVPVPKTDWTRLVFWNGWIKKLTCRSCGAVSDADSQTYAGLERRCNKSDLRKEPSCDGYLRPRIFGEDKRRVLQMLKSDKESSDLLIFVGGLQEEELHDVNTIASKALSREKNVLYFGPSSVQISEKWIRFGWGTEDVADALKNVWENEGA
jgi:NAD-dependent SIR2 family protein deacetylase